MEYRSLDSLISFPLSVANVIKEFLAVQGQILSLSVSNMVINKKQIFLEGICRQQSSL